jgi:hypothetical protein
MSSMIVVVSQSELQKNPMLVSELLGMKRTDQNDKEQSGLTLPGVEEAISTPVKRSRWEFVDDYRSRNGIRMGGSLPRYWTCANTYKRSCKRHFRPCIHHEILQYCEAWKFLGKEDAKECYQYIIEKRERAELNSIPVMWMEYYERMADLDTDPKTFLPINYLRSFRDDWNCGSDHSACCRSGRKCIYHELRRYRQEWYNMSSDQRKHARSTISLDRSDEELSSMPEGWRKYLSLCIENDIDPRMLVQPGMLHSSKTEHARRVSLVYKRSGETQPRDALSILAEGCQQKVGRELSSVPRSTQHSSVESSEAMSAK